MKCGLVLVNIRWQGESAIAVRAEPRRTQIFKLEERYIVFLIVGQSEQSTQGNGGSGAASKANGNGRSNIPEVTPNPNAFVYGRSRVRSGRRIFEDPQNRIVLQQGVPRRAIQQFGDHRPPLPPHYLPRCKDLLQESLLQTKTLMI